MRSLLSLLSPGASRGRLSVLIFHRVLAQPDPLFPEEIVAAQFAALCGWLKAWFNVLPLDDAVRQLREGALPARALAISFDDGYADNHRIAFPILARHGLSATFFIATGFLDGGRMWNDTIIEAVRATVARRVDLTGVPHLDALGELRLETAADRRLGIDRLIRHCKYLSPPWRTEAVDALAGILAVAPPRDLMLTSAEVRAMHRAGMQIGAHTRSHPILARLDDATARAEIAGGRADLESLLDAPVPLFAYPNGKPGEDYGERDVSLVADLGFEAAFSTAWGTADRASRPLELPRFTPWDRARWKFGLRLAANLCRAPAPAAPTMRAAST